MGKPDREDGFVVLCDIADFSQKKDHVQRRCVEHLDKAVRATKVWSILESEPRTRVLNCTGDGFILITTHPKIRTHPDLLLYFVLQLMKEIVDWNLQNSDAQYGVRLGLHKGGFFMGVDIFGSPNAIGSGVNTASRVASIGDPGHVLTSQEFVRALENMGPIQTTEDAELCPLKDVGWDSLLHHPADDNRTYWDVAVKHGQLVRVRAWHAVADGQTIGTGEEPRRVRTLAAVHKQLHLELETLYGGLVRRFRRLSRTLTEEVLALRLTVLFAKNRDGVLACTPVRYWKSLSSTDSRSFPTSEILYPIGEDNFWGMPAFIYRAALGGKTGVQWHTRLPSWSQGEKAQSRYAEELFTHWRFPRESLDFLGRKARAYFGLALFGVDGAPFGVLMVDSMHPLEKLGNTGRGTIDAILGSAATGRLPSLLHIRYSP